MGFQLLRPSCEHCGEPPEKDTIAITGVFIGRTSGEEPKYRFYLFPELATEQVCPRAAPVREALLMAAVAQPKRTEDF